MDLWCVLQLALGYLVQLWVLRFGDVGGIVEWIFGASFNLHWAMWFSYGCHGLVELRVLRLGYVGQIVEWICVASFNRHWAMWRKRGCYGLAMLIKLQRGILVRLSICIGHVVQLDAQLRSPTTYTEVYLCDALFRSLSL